MLSEILRYSKQKQTVVMVVQYKLVHSQYPMGFAVFNGIYCIYNCILRGSHFVLVYL